MLNEVKRFRTYSAAQLADKDLTVEYIVDGVIANQQPEIIAGKQKTLKTSLALDLAISVAGGVNFLGVYFVLKPQRVLFMSAESGLATLHDKSLAICQSKKSSLPVLAIT